MVVEKVDLVHLLSTCCRLSYRACQTIRKFEDKRKKLGTQALNATLKDISDSRTYLTEADTEAQDLIWNGLIREFGPGINIVGEEDAPAGDETTEEIYPKRISLTGSDVDTIIGSLRTYHIPEELSHLVFSDVTIFIDPVDGTREFVEGRLEACQSLIGISYRGRAVAGVVGLPFYGNDHTTEESSIKILYGVDGSSNGVQGVTSVDGSDQFVLTLSADLGEKVPALKYVREEIVGQSRLETQLLRAGACGNKCLKIVTGEADCALMNLSCSYWDTCATEALVRAAGGRMTTLLGWRIDHVRRNDQDKESYKNRYGVFVTGKSFSEKMGFSHEEFLQKFVSNVPAVLCLLSPDGVDVSDTVEPLVVDMLRNIRDGSVLTARELGGFMNTNKDIHSYTSFERDAVRYKQSVACRLRFDNGNTAFLKRIVLRELPSAIIKAKVHPFKLGRDVNANINESKFLNHPLVKKFNDEDKGIDSPQIVEAYHCDSLVYNDNPLDSRFFLLLSDFSEAKGWQQVAHCNHSQMKSVLRSLARFHAFFWLKDEAKEENNELSDHVWPIATYYDIAKQPTGQVEMISEKFLRIVTEFQLEQPHNFGALLQSRAVELDRLVHGSARQTIIHGDAKSANFFFKSSQHHSDLPEVGLIDFQWTGSGLCATDVAYAMWACPEIALLQNDGEDKLVEFYHTELQKALTANFPRCQTQSWLPYNTFCDEYNNAFLDLARCVVTDHWASVSLNTLKERKAMPVHKKKVFNAYNKDPEIAKLMVKRIIERLN